MRKHSLQEELSVTGDVTEPTTGWTVKLERAQPQGINPRILLLKLVEQAPTGIAGDAFTTHITVNTINTKLNYDQVTIEGTFTINVTHAAHA